MDAQIQEMLHSAYAAVRAYETTKSVAGLTLDHLIQEQIDRIQGGQSLNLHDAAGVASATQLSKLKRLDLIERNINSVVSAASTGTST